jgi:hypothetical protein
MLATRSKNRHRALLSEGNRKKEQVLVVKRTKPIRTRRNVFTATFARFVDAKRLRDGQRRRVPLKLPLFAAATAGGPVKGPDPVSVAVFAIDQVGPAAVRACASGVEVRIAAVDEATAKVIRAALAETSRRRPTDRLIRVVID